MKLMNQDYQLICREMDTQHFHPLPTANEEKGMSLQNPLPVHGEKVRIARMQFFLLTSWAA
jgi:hypothetical protein